MESGGKTGAGKPVPSEGIAGGSKPIPSEGMAGGGKPVPSGGRTPVAREAAVWFDEALGPVVTAGAGPRVVVGAAPEGAVPVG